MKYIKLILVSAIIASIAWFVIWHLIWMTGIEKRVRTERLSGAEYHTEGKEQKNKGQRGKTEKDRPVAEEGAMSVQESRTQTNQAEKSRHETEKPGDSKADRSVKLPDGEKERESVKKSGKWFETGIGFGRKVQQETPEPGKTTVNISNDKTMSITINNKANPVMQKNLSQPQPMKNRDVKVTGVTVYPTSTVP